jgi:hypothetical protein
MPFGIAGVSHVACLQVEEAGNSGLASKNENPPRLPRLKLVNETGVVDLYHALSV